MGARTQGKVGTASRSEPGDPHPAKFRHLVHQLLEALFLRLHLDEMLQLRVHGAQTRARRRRRGVHPGATTRAEASTEPTRRPSRVWVTEPEPQPPPPHALPRAHRPATPRPLPPQGPPCERTASAQGRRPGRSGRITATRWLHGQDPLPATPQPQRSAVAWSAVGADSRKEKSSVEETRKLLHTTWSSEGPALKLRPARFQIGPRFLSLGFPPSRTLLGINWLSWAPGSSSVMGFSS